jgi:hypothetical protein
MGYEAVGAAMQGLEFRSLFSKTTRNEYFSLSLSLPEEHRDVPPEEHRDVPPEEHRDGVPFR